MASNMLVSKNSLSTNALNDHLSDISRKQLLQVSQDFRRLGHKLHDFNRMKILVIEKNIHWSDAQRQVREKIWTKELNVHHPNGINNKYFILFFTHFEM